MLSSPAAWVTHGVTEALSTGLQALGVLLVARDAKAFAGELALLHGLTGQGSCAANSQCRRQLFVRHHQHRHVCGPLHLQSRQKIVSAVRKHVIVPYHTASPIRSTAASN